MPLFAPRIGRPGLVGLAARTAVVAGTASAVSGSMSRHQQQKAQEQAELAAYERQQAAAAAPQPAPVAAPVAPPAPAAAPAEDDLVGRITELARLHDAGILSDEEFAAAKARLLD